MHKSQRYGKGIVKTRTTMKKKQLNKNNGSKNRHHFVQRLLVLSVRQQVAKPQTLMRSRQTVQSRREYWTECTECAWRSGKLANCQRNGRPPHSSHFPRQVILNIVQITEQLLLSLRIILERILVKIETEIAEEHAGFWQGTETRDQITSLRILIHKHASSSNHYNVLYGLQ